MLHLNEFLDGLLGMMLIAWRCALGKPANSGVLNVAYGSKVDQFRELTGGADGAFYNYFVIAQPELRNGLAHGNAWFDSTSRVIRYSAGRRLKTEQEVDLETFGLYVQLAAELAQAYIAALMAIVAFESNGESRVEAVWPELVSMWRS